MSLLNQHGPVLPAHCVPTHWPNVVGPVGGEGLCASMDQCCQPIAGYVLAWPVLLAYCRLRGNIACAASTLRATWQHGLCC
jgi:hypothetical protein